MNRENLIQFIHLYLIKYFIFTDVFVVDCTVYIFKCPENHRYILEQIIQSQEWIVKCS